MVRTEGQVVHGHRLIAKIGQGHYGEVWRAEYHGQPVALKLFAARRRGTHLRREAFAQYALGRMQGEEGRFFPRVEHIDLEAQPPYIRMELIEGRPLQAALEDPTLSLEQRLAIGERILEGLASVHRNDFVHGDLSPANILLTPEQEVKLLDVGFGRLFDDTTDIVPSTSSEEAVSLGVASPLYAAPERFRSEFLEGCGKSSDIFSFGKILYQLVTGENPFVVKPVSRRFKALGDEWDNFVFRCLEDAPDRRFPDGQVALEEYRRIYRPTPAPGEYRATCTQCKHASHVPGGWAGERFTCSACGTHLEVLFYDEDSREAVTGFLMSFVDDGTGEDIEVLEEQVRKFCPACGERILLEAKKCKHCGVWVEEIARRVLRQGTRVRAASVEPENYVLPAFFTFLGYWLFWLPGVIMNFYYLQQARADKRRTGRDPAGFGALTVMLWIFTYVPLVAGGLILAGALAYLAFQR